MSKVGQASLLALSLLMIIGMASGMELARRSRRSRSKEDDPALTRYEDDCPNGLIAYEKFSTQTGVFGCAIKTAEICFTLCLIMQGANWDVTNSLPLRDSRDRDGWYCRTLPSYPTRPCYFKPRAEIEADVSRMYGRS